MVTKKAKRALSERSYTVEYESNKKGLSKFVGITIREGNDGAFLNTEEIVTLMFATLDVARAENERLMTIQRAEQEKLDNETKDGK